MTRQHLLFGFSGRISRMPWWLGIIGVNVVLFVGALIIGVVSALIGDTTGSQLGPIAWILLGALYVACLYSGIALTIKRLHDRNKSGWWVLLFYGLNILVGVAAQIEMMGSMEDPSAIGILLSILSLGVNIWFLIMLGFLKGTQGPNRYGPDPLGATRADAAF